MPASLLFAAVFAATVAAEGGGRLDLSANDRGNWTSGQVGVGKLKGSKFGISAMSYPTLDIFNLTLDDAQAIYWHDYWTPIHGDELPPALALLAFDAAVNSGVGNAIHWLQSALVVKIDGKIGDITLAAARDMAAAGRLDEVCAEFMAQRLAQISRAPIWQQDALGLSRRFLSRAFLAATFTVEGAGQ